MADSDFTQIAVGPKPVQVCPPLGNGSTVTIYNADLVNVVTVSRNNSVSLNASNGAPIQPLTSAVLDATHALYAVAPANTANLVILPGGGTMSPSPAQIAAQISALGLATEATQLIVKGNTNSTASNVATVNTTLGIPAQTVDVHGTTTAVGQVPGGIYTQGVPLANKSSVLNQQTGTGVPANSTVSLGTFSITQPSYEISFQPVMTLNTNGEVWLKVTMTWSDATTSLITAPPETWYVAVSSAAGNVKIFGTGPAKGNQLQISVNNPNTAFAATINNFVLMQNSILRYRDDWRNPTTGFSGIPTYTVPALDPDADVLFGTAPSVVAGTPVMRILPLFAGMIQLGIVVPGSGGTVTISDLASVAGIAAGSIWQKVYGATATTDNIQVPLPRVNCVLTIANATGTNTWSVRGQISEQIL